MRIAIVTFGGHAYYPHLLIKSILDLQSDALVYVPIKQMDEFIEIVGTDKRLRFFKKPRMRYPTNLITVFSIIKSIEKFRPDVVHLLEYYPWMYFGIRRLSKFPLVLTLHDPVKHLGDSESKIVPGSANLFSKHISQIIVLNKTQKKIISERYPFDDSRINVILHGNYSLFRRWAKDNVQEKENSVLFFGRIYKYKGLEYLLKAEPHISRSVPGVRFVIAGTGGRYYLKRLRKNIVHHDKFVFHNSYISDQMATTLFQEASLLVLPYIEGTQSGPLLIAYAFKKPVVATNVGGLPEYVEEGKTGFIVPPKDSLKLANKIIELLLNKKLRQTMGQNAHKKSLHELTWTYMGQQTLEVYRKACTSKR